MDKKNMIPAAIPDREQAQVLLVDGHKVTVKYSEQDNPAALRVIRDTLINSISYKKITIF